MNFVSELTCKSVGTVLIQASTLLQLTEKEKKPKQAKHLEQELSSLRSMYDKVTKENADMKASLQIQEKTFKALKAIEAAYQKTFADAEHHKSLYHEAESKRSAATTRITELTMVVNVLGEKSQGSAGDDVEALREEVQRMKRNNDVRAAVG